MTRNLDKPLVWPLADGERFELTSPTAMPSATAFLWNSRMMLQLNCRGFAIAQHLQPEPSKYSHAPNLEATTFMQPEQPWYAHHPGRFVYVKDEETGELFSAPHEPVRRADSRFSFAPGLDDIRWRVEALDIEVIMEVRLPAKDVAELWSVRIINHSARRRRVSVYPAFSIGYMSWMNLGAAYNKQLGGIVARSVTPYQKVEDYYRVRELKDCTFLLHDTPPQAWEVNRQAFEGEGGIGRPDALQGEQLAGGDASYETPVAALQYRLDLQAGDEQFFRFIFGPARDDEEIRRLRSRYLDADVDWEQPSPPPRSCLQAVTTPDTHFNAFVNHWLPRQVAFHGELDRLTTDPQTRNFLQDHMGMAYLDPADTRDALLRVLGQQLEDGSLPDGILLSPDAELKYINQVPHNDHCVWLPITLEVYLQESGDRAFLETPVGDGADTHSVFDRVESAMQWLLHNRDSRGLSYIAQGDWCDPMNMVGHGGRGVSAWLSLATAYACQVMGGICDEADRSDRADHYRAAASEISEAVRTHLWDGQWFARGITDAGRLFGVNWDDEGKIYLNPQSWALMANVASAEQAESLKQAVSSELQTADGVMMLAPPYTRMHEDIGRLTQKSPGVSENGSIYNHAAIFWIYSLFCHGETETAFDLLTKMIPGPDAAEYQRRGQLPLFIPNYYRGLWKRCPRTAGRSSQLVNTGTIAWFMRCLVEGLFGLRGSALGLHIEPKLPAAWDRVTLQRRFRGALINVVMNRDKNLREDVYLLDGSPLDEPLIRTLQAGHQYELEIRLAGGAE